MQVQKIGNGLPFNFGNSKRTTSIFELTDGRVHICIDPVDFETQPGDVNGSATRYGIREYEDGAMLLGLYVNPADRGHGLGEELVRHAMRQCTDLGTSLTTTATIHKPTISHVLRSVGFEADDGGAVVDLLPRGIASDPIIPEVLMVEPCPDPARVIQQTGDKLFYTVVSPAEAYFRFPLYEPSNLVDLHTRFHYQ